MSPFSLKDMHFFKSLEIYLTLYKDEKLWISLLFFQVLNAQPLTKAPERMAQSDESLNQSISIQNKEGIPHEPDLLPAP